MHASNETPDCRILPPRLLDTAEVAELLHMNREYFRNRFRNGLLKGFPHAVGVGRRLLWFETDIVEWLREQQASAGGQQHG